jgi:glutathione S-transferase
MTEIEVPLVEIYIQKVHRDPADQAIIDAAAERLKPALAVIENELGEREYVLESGFSVADIVMGEMATFAGYMEQVDGLVNLAAYLERLKDRPAHQRASAVGVS